MKNTTIFSQFISTLLLSIIVLNGFSYNNAFRFKIEGNNYADETIIRLLDGATSEYDGMYDAVKLFSLNPNAPSIYTQSSSNQALSINSLPEYTLDKSITVYTSIPINGTYTIHFTEIFSITPNYKISLTDISNNTHYQLLGDTAIIFTLENQQKSPTFMFNISVPLNYNPKHQTCFNKNDGSITIENPGNYNWSIDLYDSPNKKVKSITSTETSTSINNLSPGNYIAHINSMGIIDEINFTINAADLFTVDFSVSHDTIYLSDGGIVTTVNNSQNAQNYTWDFNDGTPYYNTPAPTHQYDFSGTYNITLTAHNNNCTSQKSKNIYVLLSPILTSIHTNKKDQLHILNHGNGLYQLNFNDYLEKNIDLYDVNGRLLHTASTSQKNYYLSVKDYSSGIYIVNVNGNNLNLSKKIYR
ncbi:MAG: T9SS type A sorting domain-containing protein [Vicingus serpentipes]|nr:T9SS type A sorting domain-containing protein [Vicingus serpentipes]